ncbi:Saccharopine dehydrogenase [Legionella massiliensis]|uniref:Saccharopine dehydrogenase n=1 Tax=Legionella massiliensis TaxID=1034943 RepID=A0A078KPF7_9GAMM|nr:saccharopine dehydrogenase NADP-binding domain-containing protein [Legionella massiliensis]CDZ76290.1 Saccharopine dehydrogenase [Legionella massiliensis]CEE12028.1 Saccharopine dehydrogenase [Legionella massiliensis]
MVKNIFILGGYGNFGRYISKVLGKNPKIRLTLGGRHIDKAEALINTLELAHPAQALSCDIFHDFAKTLEDLNPDIVIHTSGPFQGQGYRVAEACLKQGCHYIDLADSRDFVYGISQFDAEAREKKLFICSGASSLPALTSAIIDNYLTQFAVLEKIDYAIGTAQLTNQGLATTAGVLSYAGKPFNCLINGKQQAIYGWQGLRLQKFWQLGSRFLGNCDVPDLALFPERYPQLKTIQFQAGLELKPLQLILFTLSWLVRLRLFLSLDKCAETMLRISRWFNAIGHDNTGFYMDLFGHDLQQQPKHLRFDIYAQHGDGLYIPCIPAILLAERLCEENLRLTGASACVGQISLQDYLNCIKKLELDIRWQDNLSLY